jgi:hypothetical protein
MIEREKKIIGNPQTFQSMHGDEKCRDIVMLEKEKHMHSDARMES